MGPPPLTSFLICHFGDARYALDTTAVREVLPMLPLWRPPTLPRPLAGFVTIQDQAIAVLAPALLFDAARRLDWIDLYAHLVRTDRFCLLVDRADAVVTIADEAIRPVPPEDSFNGCVGAEIDVDGNIAHLLLIDRLLTGAEAARLADLAGEETRRTAEWAR